MSATRRAVRQAKHNMYVEARLAVVADGNVPDRAQDFALLGDLDFPVCFLLKIEPADGGVLKSTDGSQRGCGNSAIVCEFRQRFECFFAGCENDDAGLGSRVAGYFRALHGRHAALRWVWRPSLTSSMILALKASKSPGLRDVMTPWSTTTSESSHLAPAFLTSVLIDLYDVILRSLARPVSIRSQGAWQTAATIFFWL